MEVKKEQNMACLIMGILSAQIKDHFPGILVDYTWETNHYGNPKR